MKTTYLPQSYSYQSQFLQLLRLLYLITCFFLDRTLCEEQWHVYSQEFVEGNFTIAGWQKSGDGQLIKSKHTGCENHDALGYGFYETTITKQYNNLPINRAIKVSLYINTYGFDDNEQCNLKFGENSKTLKNGDPECDKPFSYEDKCNIYLNQKSGTLQQLNFSMNCEGSRNIFSPELWAIYNFKIEYLCKRDECDNCSNTEECLCNSPRQISFQNKCVDVCENKFILNSDNQKLKPCQECQPWCKKCNSEDINECFECQEDKKYITIINKTCGDCETDEVHINNFCRKCHSDCESCDGLQKNQCKKCKNNEEYIQEYNNNLCGACDVNNGYFIDKNICRKCDKNCKTCKGPNSNECKECIEQKYLNQQTQLCEECHKDCKTCYGPQQIECKQCLNNQFNIDQDNICRKCKQNEFVENNQCKQCPITCNECKNLNECTQCVQKQHFQFPSFKMCGECQKNEYLDSGTNQCRQCDSSCATCTGPLNKDCTSCSQEGNFINILGLCGLCGQYYFGDIKSNKCKACHSDCQECSGPLSTDCLSCRNNQDFFCNDNPKCQKKCYKCFQGCSECYGVEYNQCTKCSIGILQPDNTCQKRCPIRQYYVESTNSCQPCISDCLVCSNSSQCEKCDVENPSSNIFEYKGKCMNCPINSYYDPNIQNCQLCYETCLQCVGPKSNECRRCINNYYLTKDKQCVEQCPIDFIKNNHLRVCQPCKYQENICVLQCSQGYYLENQFCKKCVNNCKMCDSGLDCSECKPDNYFKYRETDKGYKQISCEKCNTDEYISIKNTCEICSDKISNCNSCQVKGNDVTCHQCSFRYSLTTSNKCELKEEYKDVSCNSKQECQKQKLIQDTIHSSFTTVNVVTVPISLTSSVISHSMTSLFWYSLQNFQMIGNYIQFKDSYQEHGLGPVVMNQFYLYNIFPLFPSINFNQDKNQINDKTLVSQYNDNNITQQSYVNYFNQSTNVYNNNVQNESQHNHNISQQYNKVKLNDSFIDNQNKIAQRIRILDMKWDNFLKENQLKNRFISVMAYWFILYILIIFIFGMSFVLKHRKIFRTIYSYKNKILIQYVIYFSNYSLINLLQSFKDISFNQMESIDFIDKVLMLGFIFIYLLSLYLLKTCIDSDFENNPVFLKDTINYKYLQKYFWIIFELRKLICIIIIVFIEYPSICSLILFLIYFGFFIYLCTFMPFSNINQLRFFQAQELLMTVIFFNLFLSHEIKSDKGIINLITILLLGAFIVSVFCLSLLSLYRLFKLLYQYLKDRSNKKYENDIIKASISFQQMENILDIKNDYHSVSVNQIMNICGHNKSILHPKLFDRPSQTIKKEFANQFRSKI